MRSSSVLERFSTDSRLAEPGLRGALCAFFWLRPPPVDQPVADGSRAPEGVMSALLHARERPPTEVGRERYEQPAR